MSRDLRKKLATPKQASEAKDVASRLKDELMMDALDRLLGKDESIATPDDRPPLVILALSAFTSEGWTRIKHLQRELFSAAPGLEMKFACFDVDDPVSGTRPCRITKRWIDNPDDMAGLIDKATCVCGCYANVSDVLAQAEKEAEEQPLRAVIIIADKFHDTLDGLNEAAISVTRLRRAGTQIFLLQTGDDPRTARGLQFLGVAGAAYFRFDPRTQERQLAEMWEAVSAFASGGETAVKAKGGRAATLLLQHLAQAPMPIIEERARVTRKVTR
jgi:hypothetical protein